MTAATWEQARHFLECDCLHRDPAKCAGLTDQEYTSCPCMCHRFISVEQMRELVVTERPQ